MTLMGITCDLIRCTGGGTPPPSIPSTIAEPHGDGTMHWTWEKEKSELFYKSFEKEIRSYTKRLMMPHDIIPNCIPKENWPPDPDFTLEIVRVLRVLEKETTPIPAYMAPLLDALIKHGATTEQALRLGVAMGRSAGWRALLSTMKKSTEEAGRRDQMEAMEKTPEGRVQLTIRAAFHETGCPRLPKLANVLCDFGVGVNDGAPGPKRYTFTLSNGDEWAPEPNALSKALSRWRAGNP